MSRIVPDPRAALEPLAQHDPVRGAFRTVMVALAEAGTEASDRDDELGFRRAFAFRAAVKRIADRWSAGDASPTRTASKKEA
jgi:hypothetical protein